MCWYLLAFRRYSPRDWTCLNRSRLWAGWLILFHTHAKLRLPNLTQLKLKQRIWKRSQSEWTTGKVEIRTRKQFLAVGKARVAIFWPTPRLKGWTSIISTFSAEGTLISASAAAYLWGAREGRVKEAGDMLELRAALYIFLHLTAMYSCIFWWVGG